MRSRLRLLVGLVLVATVGGGFWLLWRDAAARRAADRAAAAVEVLPDVSQRIQDFHRVKVENGRKVWEVQARDAQYKEGEGVVSVIDPVVAVYLADGGEVSLRGTSGTVVLDGRELRRVDVEGAIAVRFGNYELRTDRASYEAAPDLVTAPGAVHITGDGLDIEGRHMEVEVGAQRLRLAEQVRVVLQPRS
jgi:LPS export ABC transporter protein LptC